MSSLISMVGSVWSGAVAAVMQLFGTVGGVIGGWLAGLGAKLLSFQWVKNVYNFIGKIADVLKKTVFNDKAVRIMKVVLTLALFGLSVAQAVLTVKFFIVNVTDAFEEGAEFIVFFVLVCAAAVFFLCSLLLFLWRLFKKKTDYTFVAALFYFYLVAMFAHAMTGLLFYRDLAGSFDVLKIALIVVFAVTAFIKLIDRENPTSVIAFFLCAIGVLVVYFVYKSEGFAKIVQFTFGSEFALNSKEIGFISYFRQMALAFEPISELPAADPVLAVVRFGLSLSETSGKFVAGMVTAFTGFVLFVSEVAPYLLLTAFIGFAMAMLNDRPKQVSYLAKTLKGLKYLFFGLLTALLAAWITTFFYPDGQTVGVSLYTAPAVLSILAVVALSVLCAGSCKLVGEKGANRFRPKKKK